MNKNLRKKVLAMKEAGSFYRGIYADVWGYFQDNEIVTNGKRYQPSLSSVKTYLSPSGDGRTSHELDKAYILMVNDNQKRVAKTESKKTEELDSLNQTIIEILERQKQIVSIEKAIETLRIGLLKLDNPEQIEKALTHIKEISNMLG